jgi:hypothetical protein
MGLEFEPDTDVRAMHDLSVGDAAPQVMRAWPRLLDAFGVSPETRAAFEAEYPEVLG